MKYFLALCCSVVIVSIAISFPALAAEVQTTGATTISKVAPGEFLPVSMKLLNFGSNRRVDVDAKYEIYDEEGRRIFLTQETVAVETTASFIKLLQIPFDTPPGSYRAKSSITYKDQQVPATNHFPFLVERKIAGMFQSEFYLYGGITVSLSIIAGIGGHVWVKRRRLRRMEPINYSHISKGERVFYELISDTIAQMRQHVGERALDIANGVQGLVMEAHTGKVLAIKKNPSEIMAMLITRYEEVYGRKIGFFRKKGRLMPLIKKGSRV